MLEVQGTRAGRGPAPQTKRQWAQSGAGFKLEPLVIPKYV